MKSGFLHFYTLVKIGRYQGELTYPRPKTNLLICDLHFGKRKRG
ncbi:hypothetical protein CLOSTMETH_00580 [[Clostridium] methylpentosum DSM 5476]|uniref:Uncharacterized protein n=1 Tax=[Clostridium] methylpentosum DSM 5476 TaxID=537013 RepID=C0E9S9_9FIRM|nr:hypothetical protein CLOSTMETH_00580 [[Clostridium] methylpentosum DSM 5476]